jgi:RNA polymerase sigma factor (sigma-70 family)
VKLKTAAVIAEYKKLSDQELVYRYLHRHEDIAFDFLFERYGHLVLGICMKYYTAPIAKEKAEAFFMQLMEGLNKFHIDEDFKLWLYNYINKQCVSDTQTASFVTKNVINSGGTNFTNTEVTDGVLKLIQETLETLNKSERQCIEAFYLKDMTYAQIANEYKISALEVREYIQSGLQTIKSKNEALKHVKQ